jgi:hypothetical protein
LQCRLDLTFFLKICQVLTNDAGGLDTHCKVNCLTFQYFVLVLVSSDNAVSMECLYSFAVHISNEYC